VIAHEGYEEMTQIYVHHLTDPDLVPGEVERQSAEAMLRQHDELYRLLTEHTNDFIRLHDLNGRSIYASRSVDRLYGRVPTTLFEFAHPEQLESCWLEISPGLLRYRNQPCKSDRFIPFARRPGVI
jgi:PAS domain-containing protein